MHFAVTLGNLDSTGALVAQWQSRGLLIPRLEVQVLPGAPLLTPYYLTSCCNTEASVLTCLNLLVSVVVSVDPAWTLNPEVGGSSPPRRSTLCFCRTADRSGPSTRWEAQVQPHWAEAIVAPNSSCSSKICLTRCGRLYGLCCVVSLNDNIVSRLDALMVTGHRLRALLPAPGGP